MSASTSALPQPSGRIIGERTAENVLSVRSLFKSFRRGSVVSPIRRAALSDVSFDVAEGEIVGVVGHVGSGKTTLFQCLGGLLRVDRGEVILHGQVMNRAGGTRGIAFIPAAPLYYECLSVCDVLEYRAARVAIASQPHDGASQARSSIVRDVANALDLSSMLDRCVLGLSIPALRRLALAEALIDSPAVILLDTSETRGERYEHTLLMSGIQAIAARGTSVLVASRSAEWLTRTASRFMFLDAGCIIGSRTDLSVDTDHSYAERQRSLVAERIH
ncbi:MAG TPA: ATP-binding cassette domain-containing protein [Gemmatimonadaceae bacterium]|nr:ATP-binding cassette domain-containing protein [Gemmatimonadaceae bacterium]